MVRTHPCEARSTIVAPHWWSSKRRIDAVQVPVQVAIVAGDNLIVIQGRPATPETNDRVVLAISKLEVIGDFLVSRTCSVQPSGDLCQYRRCMMKETCLLVCFYGGSLFVFALFASFHPFKVVSDRTGKVKSYRVRLDKVTKKSAQGSGWCCVR